MNLSYLNDISGGDIIFKKELITIFINQVPEFISNMEKFLFENDLEMLAKEAHSAKSSALIFMMEETGKDLKQIQLLAENKDVEKIPCFLEKVRKALLLACNELQHSINEKAEI